MPASVLSLRTDPEVDSALELLGADYGNRSDTLKAAILALAAQKRSQQLRAESAAAINDPADLAESRKVMEIMDDLRAW
jgi:Arc/MetJ-type ribon-helix-helix transcriptional regulator